jgi:hypothetical protein
MNHYQLPEEEEMDTDIVTKKIKKTKAKFLNRIFDINQIKKFIEKHKLERILLIILIILLFSHISYGYTINLHRTILLCIFTLSFFIVFMSYTLVKSTYFFSELMTNPKLKPIVSITFIAIFIVSCILFHKVIPFDSLKKYNFSIPMEKF